MKQTDLPSPDQQISLTDPDSHSMATRGRGSSVVGHNVHVAVDTKHRLIVTHEVTITGSDRAQLAHMAKEAQAVLQSDELEAATVAHPFGTIKARMAHMLIASSA